MSDFNYDSEDWQLERERVLESWDGFCESCGALTDHPHVHHRYGTSKSVYEVLCPDCHQERHPDKEIITDYTKYCKFCGKPFRWVQTPEGWKPFEINSNQRHVCYKPEPAETVVKLEPIKVEPQKRLSDYW